MLLVLFVSWFHFLCCLLTLLALTVLFVLALTCNLVLFLFVTLIIFTVINTLVLLFFPFLLDLLQGLSDTPNHLPRLGNLGIYDDAVFAFAL